MFKRKDPTKLQQQLASLKSGGGFEADANEWKVTQDAAGNGQAVIRFLPAKDDNSLPFVKLVSHSFKLNNKWYIENCSSTHGDFDNCPVCAYMSKNDSYNTNRTEYDKIKRKTSYWANILVLKDPANPENEGKIFKHRFGFKVMEKIKAMIEVDPALGETPVDVTCVFEGANFVYKIKKVGDFPNYDDSKFQNSTPIGDIDNPAKQEFLMNGMHDLTPIVAPTEFKPLEELTKRFGQVMGAAAAAGGAASAAAAQLDAQLDDFDSQMANFAESQSGGDDLLAGTSSASTDNGIDDLGLDDDVPFDTDDNTSTAAADSSFDDELNDLLDGI